jgi:FKBP-type peptidyl-prolyl cis-trans isomerase SlyD
MWVSTEVLRHGDPVRLQYRIIRNDPEMALEAVGLDEERHDAEFVLGVDPEPLPGLATTLIGQRRGAVARVTIPAERAFGLRRAQLVFEAMRENLPQGVEITPGMPLYTSSGQGVFHLRVVSLTERGAILDGNHPLASYALELDIRLLA